MWNGAFSPSLTKSITEHFDIIHIHKDDITGIVSVTVVFHKSPGKQYVFDIDGDKFQNNKKWIGEEILRQLSVA